MGDLRISTARFMIRLGNLVQSLAITVMRPDDLVEFSRRTYAQSHDVASWNRDALVDGGLHPHEQELLEKSPVQSGRLLLLGVGGGREAIPLARHGFQVTGLDFVPAMVEQAVANADRRGVSMEGLVQEITCLDVPAGSYDLVWLLAFMYSCVPTRSRRVEMLRRVARALRPGGCFICDWWWDVQYKTSAHGLRLRRIIAWLTRGYRHFEPGDTLRFNREFFHIFGDKDAIQAEFADGGFDIVHFDIAADRMRGSAVLRKKG